MAEPDSPQPDLVISHAQPDEIPAIVEFTKQARIRMFPAMPAASHDDLAARELAGRFREAYLDEDDDDDGNAKDNGSSHLGRRGAFLTARVDGELVGTIAYVAYDGRFPYLAALGEEPERGTVEVIRLFVEPEMRRGGVASKLFGALRDVARQRGVRQLYLHSHPYLQGAIAFWERQGFEVIHVDENPVWDTTVHMLLPLP